jgi:hypothetical protein
MVGAAMGRVSSPKPRCYAKLSDGCETVLSPCRDSKSAAGNGLWVRVPPRAYADFDAAPILVGVAS